MDGECGGRRVEYEVIRVPCNGRKNQESSYGIGYKYYAGFRFDRFFP